MRWDAGEMAASVRIKRIDGARSDRARAYKVLIDGGEVGRIAAGEEQDHALAPGEHTLRVVIDWTGSPSITFSVADEESIAFTCQPSSGLAIVKILRSFVQRDSWVVLERQ